jgi:hypothetical protein
VSGGEFAEGLLPAGAECRDAQGGVQLRGITVGQVEQRVGVGDAEMPGAPAGEDDLVAGLDVSFGDDAQVEAGAVVGHQE